MLSGTLNGRPITVRTALLTASDLGELALAVGDIEYSCADSERQRKPPPYTGFLIFLADISGAGRIRPRPPAHAGVFSVVHFLDYRAAWFQERGAPPRPGQGKRPPDGSYAALLSSAGGGKGANWPIGTSGQVTLASFPQRPGELVPVTLDVTVESGERLRGTLHAIACKKVFEATSPPAPRAEEPAAPR